MSKPNRDLSDSSFLKSGISHEEVVKRVGVPDSKIGSGMLIYVYNLNDGSNLVLNYGQSERALQIARLVLPNKTSKDIVALNHNLCL